MGSLLALVFIGGIAATGILVATRPTVADGRVIAATIASGSKTPGLTVACDPQIPIGVDGAVFRCEITGDDGSTTQVRYTLDRGGAYSAAVVDSTGPSPARGGGDPWR